MPSIDIVLVNPSNQKAMFGPLSGLAAIEPPVWTGLIAGYLRQQGFTVHIIDADAEGWGPEETATRILAIAPLAVGIGAVGANPSVSSTPKMPAARALLQLLQKQAPRLRTILYGIHPSSLPEKTLKEEFVHFVCRGEPFKSFAELLRRIKSGQSDAGSSVPGLWYQKDGRIVSQGWSEQIENLDELPFIAWDLLPMDKYRAHNWHCFGHIQERAPYAVIYTSLGCFFNCTYCNIHDLYGPKPGIRFRSPEKVIEEIDYLVKTYHVRNIKFLDELFVLGINEKMTQRLNVICDALIERNYGLNIWVYARIDTVTEEILRKLKKAGVTWVSYGIESGSKRIRDKVSKGQFDDEKILRAVQMTYDAGLHIVGNFIFGLPDDDLASMQETLDLAKRINCEYANLYCAMAYPGSKLYEEAVSSGVPMPENWMGFSQYGPETLPLPTRHLSAAQVLRFRDNAFMEYYTRPEYLKMIEDKFGSETLAHIKQITQYKMKRKLLE